jgi:DNA-binding SARP family transcriptional activator
LSLEIYLLGQFKLTANNISIELPSRPAQSLLAYLALNAGAMLRREKLASVLWGETSETNARGYLRQALWRIRKSWESAALHSEDYFQINEISATFNPQSDYWLDADQILKPTQGRTLDELIQDISLYRGELLPGFYDEWVGFERDRFLSAYHQKMNNLLERLLQARRWDDVLKWAEQWIRLGYSPEPAYRALLKAHAGMGNSAMLPVTYQRCVEALNRELGVDPSIETIRLYEQLRRAEADVSRPPLSPIPKQTSLPAFLSPGRPQPQHIERATFVAREAELEQLDNNLNQALSGKGSVIFITGEAGSGKTSLVNEFTQRARARLPDLIVTGGNCNAHTGIGDPYLPFREILELLSGDVEARWLAGAITKDYAQFLWNLIPITTQALADFGPDLIDTFVSGASLIERAAAYSSTVMDSPIRLESLFKRNAQDSVIQRMRQDDLFIQYNKVLQAIARQAPLLLVLDDLQWADLGSISLLFHLGRNLPGNRILILGAYRPEEISMGRVGERHPLEPVTNELKRLFGEIEVNIDQAERRAFIDELLDSEPNRLGTQFRDRLYGLTSGHPLFTVELLRGMQERGDLVKDADNRWIEGISLDWETLPARVEAVIAERINRLDPALQSILRTASVEGELFTAEVVARVQSRDELEVLNRLSNDLDRMHYLIRAHSIQRMDGQLISSYRFRHTLVQKYLYNSLDEVERVHLHERVGNVLESLYAVQNRTAFISPQLARHFEEARIAEKAINYLQQSGDRALKVFAYREAVAHLVKGLALVASLPNRGEYAQLELALQLDLTLAWHLADGSATPGIERIAERALELCQQYGNTIQLCQLLSEVSVLYYVKGDLQNACTLGQRTLDLALQAGDPLLIALGNWCMGIFLFAGGDYPRSREHLERLLSFYDPGQHHYQFIALRGVDIGLSGMAYLACCLSAWVILSKH